MAADMEAIITLTPLAGPQDFTRVLNISRSNREVLVGRASKNIDKGLTASKDNAWFDSPIMSRKHAVFTTNSQNRAVFIQDFKSTHGTFVSGRKLMHYENCRLANWDVITFGVKITAGSESYPPRAFTVNIEWRTPSETNRPSVTSARSFQVPEDEQDSSSDISEADSLEMLATRPRTYSVPSEEDSEEDECVALESKQAWEICSGKVQKSSVNPNNSEEAQRKGSAVGTNPQRPAPLGASQDNAIDIDKDPRHAIEVQSDDDGPEVLPLNMSTTSAVPLPTKKDDLPKSATHVSSSQPFTTAPTSSSANCTDPQGTRSTSLQDASFGGHFDKGLPRPWSAQRTQNAGFESENDDPFDIEDDPFEPDDQSFLGDLDDETSKRFDIPDTYQEQVPPGNRNVSGTPFDVTLSSSQSAKPTKASFPDSGKSSARPPSPSDAAMAKKPVNAMTSAEVLKHLIESKPAKVLATSQAQPKKAAAGIEDKRSHYNVSPYNPSTDLTSCKGFDDLYAFAQGSSSLPSQAWSTGNFATDANSHYHMSKSYDVGPFSQAPGPHSSTAYGYGDFNYAGRDDFGRRPLYPIHDYRTYDYPQESPYRSYTAFDPGSSFPSKSHDGFHPGAKHRNHLHHAHIEENPPRVNIADLVNQSAPAQISTSMTGPATHGLASRKRKLDDVEAAAEPTMTGAISASESQPELPDAQPRDHSTVLESPFTQETPSATTAASTATAIVSDSAENAPSPETPSVTTPAPTVTASVQQLSSLAEVGPARKKAKTSPSKAAGIGKFVSGVAFGVAGVVAAFIATIPASVREEALREVSNAL